MRVMRLMFRLANGAFRKSNGATLSRCLHAEAGRDWSKQQRFCATGMSAERSTDSSSLFTLQQAQHDARQLCGKIRESVLQSVPNTKQYDKLRSMLLHHFDGEGKYMRPTFVLLLGRLVSSQFEDDRICEEMRNRYETIAISAEMIHTASLMHDDLLDSSEMRRGKPSAQCCFGQREAVLAGDLLLSISSRLIASLGDPLIVEAFSQMLDDLVTGELVQLGKAKADDAARFSQYIAKCYLKTGSLFANSARAVVLAADPNSGLHTQCVQERTVAERESDSDSMQYDNWSAMRRTKDKMDAESVACAFDFGRQFGIAFQVVDDLLDVVAAPSELGKPAGADLLAGVVTAPVLFAARSNAELNAMVVRNFNQPNDARRAMQLVANSNGVAQTRTLARQHADQALQQLFTLANRTGTAQRGLRELAALRCLTERMLSRSK